jgi:SAM-dependent methyltransferase
MNARPDWWKDFFSGLVVDFWREALPAEVTKAEVAFLKRQLDLSPGARVLDVPCGHGRLAIELAADGLDVTGVDLSPELLESAREAASRRGVSDRTAWRLADMRDLPTDARFEAAFCMGGSFGYLGDEGDEGFLRAVGGALAAGGRFTLDASKAAESLFPAFRERHDITAGGIRFEAENRYDVRRGVYENRYRLTRLSDGRVEEKLAAHRIYTVAQHCAMLEAAGLEVLDLFGSLEGAPLRLGSAVFIVARKPLEA